MKNGLLDGVFFSFMMMYGDYFIYFCTKIILAIFS